MNCFLWVRGCSLPVLGTWGWHSLRRKYWQCRRIWPAGSLLGACAGDMSSTWDAYLWGSVYMHISQAPRSSGADASVVIDTPSSLIGFLQEEEVGEGVNFGALVEKLWGRPEVYYQNVLKWSEENEDVLKERKSKPTFIPNCQDWSVCVTGQNNDGIRFLDFTIERSVILY